MQCICKHGSVSNSWEITHRLHGHDSALQLPQHPLGEHTPSCAPFMWLPSLHEVFSYPSRSASLMLDSAD